MLPSISKVSNIILSYRVSSSILSICISLKSFLCFRLSTLFICCYLWVHAVSLSFRSRLFFFNHFVRLTDPAVPDFFHPSVAISFIFLLPFFPGPTLSSLSKAAFLYRRHQLCSVKNPSAYQTQNITQRFAYKSNHWSSTSTLSA